MCLQIWNMRIAVSRIPYLMTHVSNLICRTLRVKCSPPKLYSGTTFDTAIRIIHISKHITYTSHCVYIPHNPYLVSCTS